MPGTLLVNPDEIIDDGTLRLRLGLTSATTAKARRSGALRYSRKGHRVLYIGRWVIDWIAGDHPLTADEVRADDAPGGDCRVTARI